MIPTLFGVTIVAFAVMQLAPGDPMDNLGAAGVQQSEGESRDNYLIRKRDMKLDKPWFLNFNYFSDDYYQQGTLAAARILSMTTNEVETMLERVALASAPEKSEKWKKSKKQGKKGDEESEGEEKSSDDEPALPTVEDLANLAFIKELDIEDFQKRLLQGPTQWGRLAQAIRGSATNPAKGGGLTRKWCEDATVHGVPEAKRIATSDEFPLMVRVGALQAMNSMLVEPVQYTYPTDVADTLKATDEETTMVTDVWDHWWTQEEAKLDKMTPEKRKESGFPVLSPEREAEVTARFDELVEFKSRSDLIRGLDYLDPNPEKPTRFTKADMQVFIPRLTNPDATLRERIVASMGLKLYLGQVLPMTVPKQTIDTIVAAEAAIKAKASGETEVPDTTETTDTSDETAGTTVSKSTDVETDEEADDDADEEIEPQKTPEEQLADAKKKVEEIAANCALSFRLNKKKFEPSFGKKCWNILADTQYAHMVSNLVTFQFGRSTLRTREPVGGKIWRAFLVTAPLMICAQLMIYLIAVPLGIICAVNRGTIVDRLISLKLFFLYSIPPFIAGMLFLLFFCYGTIGVDWMPKTGLHSEGSENWGFFAWLVDYIWHAALPITCLSLFSLAGMAMFSRTSMLDVIGQDYIRTARAKGVPEDKVIFKHTFRNAMIPLITLFAGFLPAMLGGSVLIEYLFSISGMGKLGLESIEQKDYPVLMAILYINAIIVMISIMITDILYVFVDPRISFESKDAGG